MKLKNKKTGEIKAFDEVMREAYKWNNYNSLAEINEEWEDAPEEAKGYWSYDTFDNDVTFNRVANGDDKEKDQAIGNYFETKEEAEKAVEKLKAWKRLRDNGFKFVGTNNSKRKTGYFINYYLGRSFNSQDECEQAMKDLDLLFRGED